MRAAAPLPLGLALLVAACWLTPGDARSDEPNQPGPTSISVRVRVVEAAEQQGQIDEGCEDLVRFLSPMRFGSLRMVEDKHLQLAFGQQAWVALPTGDRILLLPISVVKRRLHMHVEAPKINGRLQMRPGEPVVVGGQRHGNGRLIISIVPEF